jgi:hypothetical protein
MAATSKHLAPKQRTFSKRLVVVNCALAWGIMAWAVATGQAGAVASYVFAFLAAVGGTYMGVGHADLRMFLSSLTVTAGGSMATDGAAMPEPQEPANVPA